MSHHMSEKIRTISSIIGISLTVICSACGLKNNPNVDRRNPAPASAALVLQKTSQLELSGALIDLDGAVPTNSRNFSLVSKFKISALEPGDENFAFLNNFFPPVKVRITDASGVLLWEKSENFREIKWDLPLLKSGELTVTVEALTALPGVEPVKPWVKKFTTDFDVPKITLNPIIDSPNDSGDRPLKIGVTVLGEKEVSCPTAQVQAIGETSTQEVPLKPDSSREQIPGDKEFFTGSILLKADDLKGTPMVVVTCRDLAGNTAEVREPARPATANYSLVVAAKGPMGPFDSDGEILQVVYLQKPELDFDLQVLDASTGTFLPLNLIDVYKNNFIVYVTDKSPESLADLNQNKGLLWSQKFEKSMSVKLSPLLERLQTVYVSLVFKDQLSGKDLLASTTKIPMFIAKSAPKVAIITKPQLTKPELNRPITLVTSIQIADAPLSTDGINVEVTLDGVTWTMVPSTINTVQSQSTLTFNYPYAKEMPLRARVKVRDQAGYQALSNTSGLLAGFDPSQLGVEAKERELCKDKSNGGAFLKPWLVSRYLCRRGNGNGGLSPTPYVTLLMQNRGSAAPQFFETSVQKKGLGYKVFVNGSEARFYRIEPATDFTLEPADQRLFHLALDPEWLKSDLVEIRMDLESTEVNSTINSCYSNQKPYTSVVVLDRASGLVPALDAFECAADQRF